MGCSLDLQFSTDMAVARPAETVECIVTRAMLSPDRIRPSRAFTHPTNRRVRLQNEQEGFQNHGTVYEGLPLLQTPVSQTFGGQP